jgi:hypothetical protein
MVSDPERERLAYLASRVGSDEASEGERAELELHLADRPELRPEVMEAVERARLGKGWLARVEADQRVRRIESGRRVRVERAIGIGLVGAGWLLAPAVPALAPAAFTTGALVLIWSFARVRLRELRDDPYRDIEK